MYANGHMANYSKACIRECLKLKLILRARKGFPKLCVDCEYPKVSLQAVDELNLVLYNKISLSIYLSINQSKAPICC